MVRFIHSGELLRSKSGRQMAPAPTINTKTRSATTGSMRRVRVWLLAEARIEASATSDHFMAILLRGLDPGNFAPVDYQMVNDVLFGHEDGPGPEHRLTAEQPATT